MIGIVFLTFLSYAAILVRLLVMGGASTTQGNGAESKYIVPARREGVSTARLELGCFIGVLIITVGFIVTYSVYVF
jgi:hypothetical protein